MKKRFMAILSLLLCAVVSVGVLQTPMTAKAEEVKISNVNYKVSYKGIQDIFLCNKISIGSEIGTEVYLTYTVDKLEQWAGKQQGVIATGQPGKASPGKTGTKEYVNNKQILLEEGCTYFYKFAVTEKGFEYTIIKAKGEESSYVKMMDVSGNKTDPLEYFGLWLGGGAVKAELSDVRCYDRNGNDLGIRFSKTSKVSCVKEVSYSKNTNLNHTYKLTVEKKSGVAISSLKPTTSNTVFIEYKVESSDTSASQTGTFITLAPKDTYPHGSGKGHLVFETMKEKQDGKLLLEGAEYIICMEKANEELNVTVQRTYQGEKTVFSFPTTYKPFDQKYNYFGLWWEGTVNCVLTNFKCYDANNNNLGVQCNKSFTKEHAGEIEDYAGCEAIYYCKENATMIALFEDQSLKYRVNGVTKTGSYYIDDTKDKTITISYGEGKENLAYLYKRITSEQGQVYNRLGTYTVSFETGNDSKVESQVLTTENGYTVMKPEEPQVEGKTFECWVTQNGEAFDFDSVVAESITLYAKWQGEDVRQTMFAEPEVEPVDYSPYISAGVSAVILIGAIVGSVFLLRRGGKKHE